MCVTWVGLAFGGVCETLGVNLALCPQILQNVLKGCSEDMLGSLSLTACQFMEEPGMAVQVRESKHPYDNDTNFEVRGA